MDTSTVTKKERIATKKQTFMLYCLCKIDFRPLNLTIKEASEAIKAIKYGKKTSEKIKSYMENYEKKPKNKTVKKTIEQIDCAKIHAEAHNAGMKAFIEEKVQKNIVIDKNGMPIDIIDGPCGFAWLNFKMKNRESRQFGKWIVKNRYGKKDSYRGGITIFAFVGGSQSMHRLMAYASAFSNVLNKYNISSFPQCRMD